MGSSSLQMLVGSECMRRCSGLTILRALFCMTICWMMMPTASAGVGCDKTIFLTFDTGNMSVAQQVADILQQEQVKATFFVASEKTSHNDFSLDASWKNFWLSRINEGHAFGSHTLHHTYWKKDAGSNKVIVQSQFGPHAGKLQTIGQEQVCQNIQGADQRFKDLTGRSLDKIWRAPGGKTSPMYIAMAKACGYKHIAWAKAGFLGDELSSSAYPNAILLQSALDNLKDGDITMAHLGIWSRKDPWAPVVLQPLIQGLKAKGFCFETLANRVG